MFNYYNLGRIIRAMTRVNNLGNIIKTIARVSAIVRFVPLCIAAAILFWISIGSGSFLFFFGSMLLFPCAYYISWISGVMLYSFGELLDNSEEMRKNLECLNRN